MANFCGSRTSSSTWSLLRTAPVAASSSRITSTNNYTIDVEDIFTIATVKITNNNGSVTAKYGAHCHCNELNREWERQILAHLCQPVTIISESVRNAVIYYNVLQHGGNVIEMKDSDASKFMPRQLVEFYEKYYNWNVTYNLTLAELMRHVIQFADDPLVLILNNRENLRVQFIRGGFHTTDGFFFIVKWKNISAYDYVDAKYMKDNHVQAILIFYQGLSLNSALFKHMLD